MKTATSFMGLIRAVYGKLSFWHGYRAFGLYLYSPERLKKGHDKANKITICPSSFRGCFVKRATL